MKRQHSITARVWALLPEHGGSAGLGPKELFERLLIAFPTDYSSAAIDIRWITAALHELRRRSAAVRVAKGKWTQGPVAPDYRKKDNRCGDCSRPRPRWPVQLCSCGRPKALQRPSR